MVQSHGARQPALIVFAVGVELDLLAGHHLAEIQTGLLCQLDGLLAGQLVSGVVQGEQEHAVALVRQLHGVKDQLVVGSGKNIAHSLNVQHPLSHKAGLGGLVTGAAVGNDGHTVGVSQVLADDQMAVYIQNIRIGQPKTGQFLVGDGFRGVDKFFHFHIAVPPV